MIGLLDLDSVLYKSVYRCITFSEIREIVNSCGIGHSREVYESEVTRLAISRTYKKVHELTSYIEERFCDLYRVEMYITTCGNNFRNDIEPTYKQSRKSNKYVRAVREYFKNNDTFYSDTLEADDLIADRARELGKNNYLIISIDKDLKTIGGHYWSFYTKNVKDENGYHTKVYKQPDVEFIEDDEANRLFYIQMLMGDKTDDIRGLDGIGVKRAEKILKDSKNDFITVARTYILKGLKHEFYKQHRLLKLGDY